MRSEYRESLAWITPGAALDDGADDASAGRELSGRELL
jgi:hypothetical protein